MLFKKATAIYCGSYWLSIGRCCLGLDHPKNHHTKVLKYPESQVASQIAKLTEAIVLR